MTGSPAGVQDVIDRLRDIDGSLPADDGAAVFNRMYLEVTERVAEGLRGSHTFHDDAFMAHLDVAFASLWLTAYDAAQAGQDVPKAWAPLFERRATPGLLPVQFALAGMNAHIEHDLPLAVIATCRARRTSPDRPGVHADYEAVNGLLAAAEAQIRRSFLSEAGRLVDRRVGHVVHLVSSWDIDKARDLAWVNVEALWTMRPVPRLYRRYSDALARTVGMTSRCLLTPCL
ncbi:MAG TPA: DUF5995 family protein [Actinomycetes bacterium]